MHNRRETWAKDVADIFSRLVHPPRNRGRRILALWQARIPGPGRRGGERSGPDLCQRLFRGVHGAASGKRE